MKLLTQPSPQRGEGTFSKNDGVLLRRRRCFVMAALLWPFCGCPLGLLEESQVVQYLAEGLEDQTIRFVDSPLVSELDQPQPVARP